MEPEVWLTAVPPVLSVVKAGSLVILHQIRGTELLN